MAFKGFGDYLNQRHQKRLLQNYEFLTSSVKSSNTFSSISPSLRDIFETSAKRINDGYPLLFKDLLFWINGFTGSRINSLELRDLCALNGAMLAEYDSAKVTHILGTQLPDSKIQKLKKPMVHPDWILECVKQNKILSWSRYRIVPVTIQQSVSMFFDSGPFVIPKQNSDSTLNTGTENRKDKNKVYYSPELGKSNTSPATTCSLVDTRDEDDSASSPTPNEKRRRLEDSHQDIEIEDFFKPKEIVDDFNFEFQQDEEMDLYNHVHKDIFVNFENDNLIKNQYHSNETSTDSEEDSKALEWFGPQPDVNMTGAWVKRNISTAPGFLERYYESSRLHKLSTWKNELKDWVRQQYQQRQKLRPIHIKTNSSNHPRTVMHVDLDCFFASVSLLKHPEFQDCPVCVAHSAGVSGKSTSEIASCNYIARSFGIKNGMSIGKAIELCRDLKVVGYEFDMYVDASKKFFSVLLDFSDTIEVVSCDEAYIDVSSQVKSQVLTEVDLIFDDSQNPCQPPVCLELELAEKIRKRVFHDTGIHASIGISSNLLLARLATGKAKPNGAYFLDGEHETSRIMFLKDIPVRSVPGIGWVLGKKLEDKGTHTCGDLMKQSKTELIQIHGPKTGKMLFEYCRGIDARLLSKPEIRQSVGTDVNWGIRFEKEEQVFDFLKQLSEEVSKRLEKAELVGKMITVRAKKRKHKGESYKILGHGNCDNFSKSILLNKHTKDPDIIFRESLSIFKHFKIDADDLRGLGIIITKLEEIFVGDSAERFRMKDLRSHFTKQSEPRPPLINIRDLPKPNFSVQVAHETKATPVSPSNQLHINSVQPTTPKRHAPSKSATPTSSPCKRTKPTTPTVHRITSIANFFPKAAHPQPRSIVPQQQEHQGQLQVTPSQVDMSVFDQLPPSIQKELSIQWKLTKSIRPRTAPPVKTVAATMTAINPNEGSVEAEMEVSEVLGIVVPAWVEVCNVPDERHIDRFIGFVGGLVDSLRLDEAVALVQALKSEVQNIYGSEQRREWDTATRKVEANLVNKAKYRYGSNLKV